MAMGAKPRGQRLVVGREDEKLHLTHMQRPGMRSPTPQCSPGTHRDCQSRSSSASLLSASRKAQLVLDEEMASSRALSRATAMSVLQLSQNCPRAVVAAWLHRAVCCRGRAVWVQGRQGAG